MKFLWLIGMAIVASIGYFALQIYRIEWKHYRYNRDRYKWILSFADWDDFSECVRKHLEEKLKVPCKIVVTKSGHEFRAQAKGSPSIAEMAFSIETLAFCSKNNYPPRPDAERVADQLARLYAVFSSDDIPPVVTVRDGEINTSDTI